MFDIKKIISEQLQNQEVINLIKNAVLRELITDKKFKEDFCKALGVKDDVILLNGDNIKIEVRK